MQIRPMTIDDTEAVTRLCHQLGYRALPEQVAARIAQLLEHPHEAPFVGEEQGAVLGWIHVRASITLTSEARGEIVGLVVDQEARRRGLGRALVEHAEAWARRNGLGALRVRSAVSRDAAHRFYEGSGYRAVKQQEVFDKVLENASAAAPGTVPEPSRTQKEPHA